MDWNRVKLAPILKSISYLANTASATSLSGLDNFLVQAAFMSYLVSALKWALLTIMLGLTYLHRSITSNAIASPSLSQSSHNMSTSAVAACFYMFLTISLCFSTTYFSSGTLNSYRMSVFFQSLHLLGNRYSLMCPHTDVTIMLMKYRSASLVLKWNTGLYLLRVSSFLGPSLNLQR